MQGNNIHSKLVYKILHSERKCGYFKPGIPITYIEVPTGRPIPAIATNVDIRGENDDMIVAWGNGCPMTHITDEKTLEKMYNAFIPTRNC